MFQPRFRLYPDTKCLTLYTFSYTTVQGRQSKWDQGLYVIGKLLLITYLLIDLFIYSSEELLF